MYLAALSCLPLYSVCASLPHSLTSWATVSPLLPQILHIVGFYCVINMKSRIICSQSLFPGATYQIFYIISDILIPWSNSCEFHGTPWRSMDVPCRVIMPSFIFCLRQLTALTHLMGHRFSLTSANSAHRGILLCDQYEISYNLFSKLVPGRYISDILYHIRYSNSMV